MGTTNRNAYTIQLFATDNVQPDKMERFLSRARSVVDLSDLYVHPVTNGGRARFRVTYGVYPGREQAAAAEVMLPENTRHHFSRKFTLLAKYIDCKVFVDPLGFDSPFTERGTPDVTMAIYLARPNVILIVCLPLIFRLR